MCNIVGYVVYVLMNLPVIWHIISVVLGTFCLYDFVERKYFSTEQSYSCRQNATLWLREMNLRSMSIILCHLLILK